jgi:hypothetical protein
MHAFLPATPVWNDNLAWSKQNAKQRGLAAGQCVSHWLTDDYSLAGDNGLMAQICRPWFLYDHPGRRAIIVSLRAREWQRPPREHLEKEPIRP